MLPRVQILAAPSHRPSSSRIGRSWSTTRTVLARQAATQRDTPDGTPIRHGSLRNDAVRLKGHVLPRNLNRPRSARNRAAFSFWLTLIGFTQTRPAASLTSAPHQAMENLQRDRRSQVGKSFEHARDIGEIFLTLAAQARHVLHSPDLSRQNIFDRCDRDSQSQDVSESGPIDERVVSRIELNLNAKVRIHPRQVEVVREARTLELAFEHKRNVSWHFPDR